MVHVTRSSREFERAIFFEESCIFFFFSPSPSNEEEETFRLEKNESNDRRALFSIRDQHSRTGLEKIVEKRWTGKRQPARVDRQQEYQPAGFPPRIHDLSKSSHRSGQSMDPPIGIWPRFLLSFAACKCIRYVLLQPLSSPGRSKPAIRLYSVSKRARDPRGLFQFFLLQFAWFL